MAVPHPDVYQHSFCRVCHGELVPFHHLGDLRLNAFPRHPGEITKIPQVPIIMTACKDCGLIQLDRTVPPDWMYREYWYKSGVNEMMVEELQDIVRQALTAVTVRPRDVVMDIGANDGTLLSNYAMQGVLCHRIAFEPAANLQETLRQHADEVHPTYFDPSLVRSYRRSVKILTAIAMCYDLEDPLTFFGKLEELLAPGGVLVVQFQDFGRQLEVGAFDNCCHEHLEYYTLWSLIGILRQVGLSAVLVQRRAINGGSLRVVIRRSTEVNRVDDSIRSQMTAEMQLGLDTPTLRNPKTAAQTLHRFTQQVTTVQRQVTAMLDLIRERDEVLDVYGASTKGNILLQVLGVGADRVRFAIDRSPAKGGFHTITGIPIVSELTAHAKPANWWLCPIWQFKPSVITRERWFINEGGRILFPLPVVEVFQKGRVYANTVEDAEAAS